MEHHATETFQVFEKVTVRKYRGEARGRSYAELIVGDSLHRDSGRWNYLRRELDREADTYDEGRHRARRDRDPWVPGAVERAPRAWSSQARRP
jgi:hypothetical protein